MRPPQPIAPSAFSCAMRSVAVGAVIALVSLATIKASASTQQLTCTPTPLHFGAVDVGHSETLLVTLTNGGETSATVSQITVSNPGFTLSPLTLPMTLLAGQSVDINVTYTAAAIGWTGGTIRFSSNASNPSFFVGIGGTGVKSESVTASPSILSFGKVPTGSSSTLPVVLTNSSSSSVTLSAFQAIGAGFSISGPKSITLDAGQSVTLNASFAPPSAGTTGGSVFVFGPALVIPFTGTGTANTTGQLTIAPAPLNFGDVNVGSTTTQAIGLSASGASVTISSASSSNGLFSLNGGSFPFTIAAGQTVNLSVAFTPQKAGNVSGSVSFTNNSSDPLETEPVDGTGMLEQVSVNLWWNATPGVVGYNVYRGTTANGAYSKINSALDANTAFTDNSVASGQTYYYSATSVNSNGQESARSSPPVQAQVP